MKTKTETHKTMDESIKLLPKLGHYPRDGQKRGAPERQALSFPPRFTSWIRLGKQNFEGECSGSHGQAAFD
jgi:hypothetical protein